ncbi:PilZ domain-containing protein [Arcanobacterium phocae]|uniref:PilZ domain-containing protein n=1 Tax=Arcanobacterium phocae TaxID=131112 RepID=UPI001C0F05E7|nr:PilZ domain-containing protein [Arcanobacterium phocae]
MPSTMQTAQAEPLAKHVAQVNRRRTAREDIKADTLMADREGRVSGIRLLNLSEDGFMAITDTDQCEREPIRIDMPLVGWIRADIVWVLGERIGAQFREPLTPQQLREIVADVSR